MMKAKTSSMKVLKACGPASVVRQRPAGAGTGPDDCATVSAPEPVSQALHSRLAEVQVTLGATVRAEKEVEDSGLVTCQGPRDKGRRDPPLRPCTPRAPPAGETLTL